MYYIKKTNQFIDISSNSVMVEYPLPSWTHRLLTQIELDRYNDNVYKNKTYDYVFNGNIPVVTEEQIRQQKLSELETNYRNKQISGSVIQSMHFDLTDETKGQVGDWNQYIRGDRDEYQQNSGSYNRLVLTASLTDISGSQQLITDSEWNGFFLSYGAAYATLKQTKKAKERQLNVISGSILENYDVSL